MRKNPAVNWSVGGAAMTLSDSGATVETELFLLNFAEMRLTIWCAVEGAGCLSATTTASALGTNTACNVATLPRGENLRALDTRLRTTCENLNLSTWIISVSVNENEGSFPWLRWPITVAVTSISPRNEKGFRFHGAIWTFELPHISSPWRTEGNCGFVRGYILKMSVKGGKVGEFVRDIYCKTVWRGVSHLRVGWSWGLHRAPVPLHESR